MIKNNLFILIKTNQYTGNFDRELLAQVFGHSEDDPDYKDSFRKYLNKFKTEMDIDDAYTVHTNIDTSRFGRNYGEYYGTDICRHPSNPNGVCNCILIAVRDYFPESIFEQLKDRLKSFCAYYDENLTADMKYYKMQFVEV